MFRFTIRELVLLTLVVAMGVGWWVDRARRRGAYREMQYAAADWEFRASVLRVLAQDCGYEVRMKPFDVDVTLIDENASGPRESGASSNPYLYKTQLPFGHKSN